MGKKADYYLYFKRQMDEVKSAETKPSLLLHCCCGVCAGYVFKKLRKYFALLRETERDLIDALFFSNYVCGIMALHRSHTMKETQSNFMWSTYKKRGKEECSAHYIRET